MLHFGASSAVTVRIRVTQPSCCSSAAAPHGRKKGMVEPYVTLEAIVWKTHTGITQLVCPLRTFLLCPVLASQTRMSLPVEPEKSVSPLWNTHTDLVASGYLAVHNNATGCDCFINPGFARTDSFLL